MNIDPISGKGNGVFVSFRSMSIRKDLKEREKGDEDMKLDQDQMNQIMAFFDKNWPEPKTCPVCQHVDWTLAPNVYEVREFHGGGVFGTSGSIVPFIIVSCTNCGNTRFFNAIIVGAVKREGGEGGQK